MVIFHSYVKLPEGIDDLHWFSQWNSYLHWSIGRPRRVLLQVQLVARHGRFFCSEEATRLANGWRGGDRKWGISPWTCGFKQQKWIWMGKSSRKIGRFTICIAAKMWEWSGANYTLSPASFWNDGEEGIVRSGHLYFKETGLLDIPLHFRNDSHLGMGQYL